MYFTVFHSVMRVVVQSHDETFKTFIMENRANVRGKNILVDLFTPIAGENCYL